MAKTIQQLHDECVQAGWKPKKHTRGKGFIHEIARIDEARTWKVSDNYQRTISPNKLESYGECDYDLLIPVIISRRPKQFEVLFEDGEYVIDGQNKAVLFIGSAEHDPNAEIHKMVLQHEYDISLSIEENFKIVLRREAELFSALNTMRKKLTKVDELRSEVCQEDRQAMQIEEIMKTLKFVTDRFGSEEASAKELTSFSQFYYCLTGDHDLSGTKAVNQLLSAQKLWNDVYGVNSQINAQPKVHGTAFRAIALLDKFIEKGLANSTQTNFRKWVRTELAKNYTPVKLVKGFGTFASPRYTLHRIVDKYNDLMENSGQAGKGVTIGLKTLYYAATNVDMDFAHPDEDRWQKIVDSVKQTTP
tara:strand:- start:56 stop:1138 length:1083 start_codon:yes stop_codon:yes gene_type:complete